MAGPVRAGDHPVAAVLALAAAAVVAGMKGYTAIAGWVRDVPPPVLADLYLRAGPGPAAVDGEDLAGDHRRRCWGLRCHGGQVADGQLARRASRAGRSRRRGPG